MIDFIQESKPKKGVNVLLKSLDDSLDEFIGDPRKFVSCISQILKSIKEDPDKLQNVIMRFIQEKEIEHIQTDHFDFSLIDILLAQILHLYGEDVEFTKQMYDSIISTLFPTPETYYLQELISQFLLLCIGEKVSIVKKRMRALSVAPLSKVTMLSNKLVEITERYDAKIEAINQPTEPKESIESDL